MLDDLFCCLLVQYVHACSCTVYHPGKCGSVAVVQVSEYVVVRFLSVRHACLSVLQVCVCFEDIFQLTKYVERILCQKQEI